MKNNDYIKIYIYMSTFFDIIAHTGQYTNRNETINNPFYIENIDEVDGQFMLIRNRATPAVTLMRSSDNKKWYNFNPYVPQPIKAGEKCYLRGNNVSLVGSDPTGQYNNFKILKSFRHNIGGALNSLLVADNSFIRNDAVYARLFDGDTSLIDASALDLPYTELVNFQFLQTFDGCTNLINAPVFHFTKLGIGSMNGTFQNCKSLTEIPGAVNTVLDLQHNGYVFSGCFSGSGVTGEASIAYFNADGAESMAYMYQDSNITSTYIRSTDAVNNNYKGLFNRCKQLNLIEIRNSGVDFNSTTNWVKGVSATGRFINFNTTVFPKYGDNYIPKGWSVDGQETPKYESSFCISNVDVAEVTVQLTKHDNPPVIELEYSTDNIHYKVWDDLYNTSLTIPVGGNLYLRGNNYSFGNYFNYNNFVFSNRVAISGDITTLLDPDGGIQDLSKREYCFLGLFENCISLVDAKDLILPSEILGSGTYNSMFSDCVNLMYGPLLKAKKLGVRSYYQMFNNCNELKYIEIMAEESSEDSYSFMFFNCFTLQKIKLWGKTWRPQNAYGWVAGICSVGTFVKSSELQVWDGSSIQPDGSIPLNADNGIPVGWTIEEF